MAKRTHVPKFGNWNANDHMPYTVVFDHARQGRGRPINPNDPQENPGMFPPERGSTTPGRRSINPNDPEDMADATDPPPERPAQVANNNREGSTRGQQNQQIAAGAAARRQAVAGTAGNGMPSRVPPAVDGKRVNKENALESPSTSFSADQSPLHPAGYHSNQGRGGTRLGNASPAWESKGRKVSTEDPPMFAPATPNRSRLRNGGSNKEEGGKGPSAALPKFGAWDAQDPQSGDGFTVIFNNARNEKKSGAPVNIPRTPDNKHGDDLYDQNSGMGYNKGHGSKRSWFCWCSPDVKA